MTDVAFRQPFVGEPDMAEHVGFILAEEAALKTYFSGITLPTRPGAATTQEVGVWFRHPEGERTIVYPFITLDLIDVAPDYALWTSEYHMPLEGLYRPSVSPTLPANTVEGKVWDVRPYLPFQLTYQVSVHSRSSLHDKYLASIFFTDLIPPRPFWLGVDADNTWRRTEMVDFAQFDIPETTESGTKRIFRKVYTITIAAEVPQDRLNEVWQVLKVFVGIADRQYVEEYATAVFGETLEPFENIPEAERIAAGELAYYVNVPDEEE